MPEVVMPRLDPGMQSGKIVEWLKKEGDTVRKGEPILVVEGEKTTFEVEAPATGTLTKILATPGTDVQVTQPIAVIGEPSESPQQTAVPTRTAPAEQVSTSGTLREPTALGERTVASPAARRLAQEHGIDIRSVKGTGPGGRITKEDILLAADQVSVAVTEAATTRPEQPRVLKRFKLEGTRKTVAERLGFSARTAVPVTLTMEADATKLVNLKDRGERISFTVFVVKAAAKALEKHPNMNSSIQGEEVTVYSDINVCVAINTEQGLVAPVVENANRKSAREISAEIEQLSKKASENQLTVKELVGGTFTVSNLGVYEIETFAPVINPPQCAILGLGRVAYKPYAKGAEISVKSSTTLTLVFDHRIVDGVPASKFLHEVKRYLEDTESLL